jgi:hypothetical protein
MSNDDPTNVIALAWDHFRLLQQLHEAATPSLLPPDAVVVDGHVCGPSCAFLQENQDGAYTCPVSGRVYGQQTALGYNEHSYVIPLAVTPSSATPRAQSRRVYNAGHAELFSIAVQSINKLINNKNRENHGKKKDAAARKAAARQLQAAKAQILKKGGCLIKATDSIFSVYERHGGGVPPRRFTDRRITVTAQTIVHLFHRLWVPYAKVSDHRPTRAAFAIACAFILAEGSLGPRLYDPLLASYLPDQKALSAFGIRVNQITQAQRFIKEALHHIKKQ